MFFSPRCRALAIASDIILLAFSCLSSIGWCVRRCAFFSDEELDDDEDDDDEEEEEQDELLFIGGLTTRTWPPGPLAFFRGWRRREKDNEMDNRNLESKQFEVYMSETLEAIDTTQNKDHMLSDTQVKATK